MSALMTAVGSAHFGQIINSGIGFAVMFIKSGKGLNIAC